MLACGEEIMPNWRLLWACATTEGVPQRALGVAVVVGTLLNLINQGGALLGAGRVDWLKLGLTYAIPYCVATYGGVSARMAGWRKSAPPNRHVDLTRGAVLTSRQRSREGGRHDYRLSRPLHHIAPST
jgi:hypothetical protein